MRLFAQTAEAIAATTKKSEKVALAADYLRARPIDEAAASAVFLSGRAFAAWEERILNVGGNILWRVVSELARKGDAALTRAYRRYGDLGSAAAEVLADIAPEESTLNVLEVQAEFGTLAAVSGPSAKMNVLRSLLARATAIEAKYIVKIILGDLRIGFRASLVEEAIAKAYDAPYKDVTRAHMLLGDIADTLRLAAEGRLTDARMRLFHPIGFMLASPAASAGEAFSYFTTAAVEDKYDGIRAQVHCGGAEHGYQVRTFSRTLDDITFGFPELPPALCQFPEAVILDGEIVAWEMLPDGAGRALPFSELQKRLGRKTVSTAMLREVPVVFVAFDILYTNGELVIDRPLSERSALLDAAMERWTSSPHIPAAQLMTENPQGTLVFESAATDPAEPTFPRVLRAPVLRAESAAQLNQLFDAARARGNEGLMVKDLSSTYAPGRRGKAWLKLKRELATLDVVVTRVEWGHGKRARVLSDYTFAVRSGEELLNVGKAYSGLTDAEIQQMTEWFLAHTLADEGHARDVEPRIVLEVAFNAVMRSDRHASGYALRFPRILRIRDDKSAADIDTLDRVREIYEGQRLTA